MFTYCPVVPFSQSFELAVVPVTVSVSQVPKAGDTLTLNVLAAVSLLHTVAGYV